MAKLPISAADLIEFRPNAAAVIAAREAANKAAAALAASPDDEALKAALDAADAALEAAEAEQAGNDPVFRLRPPTGRIRALISHATLADPDAPRFRDNAALLDAIEAEADEAGLLDDDLAAVAEARELVKAGKNLDGDLWGRIFAAAQDTRGGRRIIADRLLSGTIDARHRVRYCLVVDGLPSPLRDTDLDRPDIAGWLGAINAELLRLETLGRDDAKNSDAP